MMRLVEASRIEEYFVTVQMDDGSFVDFRGKGENWERRYGESWEAEYDEKIIGPLRLALEISFGYR